MANKSVFASMRGRQQPSAHMVTAEGAPAYAYRDAQALAQIAVTGTIGRTYYQTAEAELARTMQLAHVVSPRYLAQTAIYARQNGKMKDMPALLLAVLAGRDPALFRAAFGRVIDNGKMLRSFVQIMRSGQTGRSSLGSAPKAMVQHWLNTASDWALLNASIGNAPSLGDVIKMVHPKPQSAAREALFAWIIGRPCDVTLLPQSVQDWIAFQNGANTPLPDVPFQMLTHLPLSTDHWGQIARNGSWQMVRQNLNTFLRNGVFADADTTAHVANLLRDPEAIAKARVLPYQVMTTAHYVSPDMPRDIVDALHDAMEVAVAHTPSIGGRVVVCPDISGSMSSAVTGQRRGATSVMRYVDIAGLITASLLRSNRSCQVLPFRSEVHRVALQPRDTILTNAERLAAVCGGGTNCAAPLAWLNARGDRPDVVIMVSDNQSIPQASDPRYGTQMMQEWEALKRRNRHAKLVCIDIAPYGTSQVPARKDVLMIGGFSDEVFAQIARFMRGQDGPDHWVRQIEQIEI